MTQESTVSIVQAFWDIASVGIDLFVAAFVVMIFVVMVMGVYTLNKIYHMMEDELSKSD